MEWTGLLHGVIDTVIYSFVGIFLLLVGYIFHCIFLHHSL